MPYPKVTETVRTKVDENGNILEKWEEPVRCKPLHMEIITIDDKTLELDRNCARLSSMLAKPHAVLKDRAYGEAVYDIITQYAPIRTETCRVLEVGGGNGDTARAFVTTAAARIPDTKLEYTIFTPDEAQAAALKEALKSIENIRIVQGDIEKIAEILDGEKFDII